VAAYYIPFVDHALDVVAGPAAVFAGVFPSASAMVDLHPGIMWPVAILGGRFEKGQMPPVNAFWSITLYDGKGFPVENAIDRHAIGDRDATTLDNDGALTIYIRHDSPGAGKESNWLPAPAGAFTLAMRLYSPAPSVAAGDWSPPP
jgi:uncharacterized protein DUF1214